MAEDPQPMTLQQRIASLNAAHIGRIPGELPTTTGRPRPQVPTRRPEIRKQKSYNIPNENLTGSVAEIRTGNQPSAPPPLPSRKQPPPLPNRQDEYDQSRRTSITSTVSDRSEARLTATRTKSDENRIKAPAWGESDLPPLPTRTQPSKTIKTPPERPKYTNRAPSAPEYASSVDSRRAVLPPPLPTRKTSIDQVEHVSERKMPPIPSAEDMNKVRQSSFSSNTQHVQEQRAPPTLPRRPPSTPKLRDVQQIREIIPKLPVRVKSDAASPPPVPVSSRPDLASIQATKPKVNTGLSSSQTTTSCMICRDFSAPDQHAALFPRQQVRSLQTLARQLTDPFPSLTDKARAIFTWLHYNIDYNVDAFFNNRVRGSTPESTLQTGLAVCEGYAALFANIATHSGLEAVVISGHGKGYGHVQVGPGSPLPPFSCGHAWNAVKIDNGEWKLIDACWGAGHVQGKNMPYIRKFAPERFTQSNEEFGIDHFPSDKTQFYLPGGRQMTWEEYIQINPDSWPYDFERPTMFNNAKDDYSIGNRTVLPPSRKINIGQGGKVRFQFGLFCPHWTLANHAPRKPPPVFILATEGIDGRNKDFVPLQHVPGHNTSRGGGDLWFADVPARSLGAPGQKLTLFAVTSFGNKQDARGLTVQEFNEGKGRTAMGFVGVAAWELV